jgi:hypothetical protein
VTIAAGSALTVFVHARTIEECFRITPGDVEAALDGVPDDRRFCTDLVINALRAALLSTTRD